MHYYDVQFRYVKAKCGIAHAVVKRRSGAHSEELPHWAGPLWRRRARRAKLSSAHLAYELFTAIAKARTGRSRVSGYIARHISGHRGALRSRRSRTIPRAVPLNSVLMKNILRKLHIAN